MKRIEAFVSIVVLAPIPPVVMGLTMWWTMVIFDCVERDIAVGTLTATAMGAAIAGTVLRRWVVSLFTLTPAAFRAVALFYSAMIYGVCMGMPVFNVGVGIVGGAVLGRRLARGGYPAIEVRRQADRWARFATVVLLVLCTLTAILGWREESLGSELQHMFRLPFVVTRPMIVALIFGGGGALLAVQYFTARAAVLWAAKRSGTLTSAWS
jgi:hypothetical protein